MLCVLEARENELFWTTKETKRETNACQNPFNFQNDFGGYPFKSIPSMLGISIPFSLRKNSVFSSKNVPMGWLQQRELLQH